MFHHRVGLAGPLTVADNTQILAVAEPALLSLEVRARPCMSPRTWWGLADPLIAQRNRRSLAALPAYLGSN